MKLNSKVICIAVLLITSPVFPAISLSPNQNSNSGNLPAGHSELHFFLSDGNWVKDLYLPNNANNLDSITIQSTAAYKSFLDTSNTSLPLEVMTIENGDTFKFIYDSKLKKWVLSLNTLTPTNNSQAELITLKNNSKLHKISLYDGKWAKKIILPSNVAHGTIVQVVSTASYASEIGKDNLLFPSSYNLYNGSEYWFIYNKDLQKWIPEFIQPINLDVKDIGNFLNAVKAPLTQINFSDGNWVSDFILPTIANDRDRIIIKSTATWTAKINNKNINSNATLKLNTGDKYEFMYVKDKNHWVLLSSPIKMIKSDHIIDSILPDMNQPVLKVNISDSNWKKTIHLPKNAQIGDKVILSSTAKINSFITAFSNLSTQIREGETRRFIYTNQGWEIDSYTIDMLLVNSPDVSKILGESAAKIRMLEGLNLTNLTAENSSAKFYLRQAGYLTYKIPAFTILDAIYNGRSNLVVQTERKRLLANGVYYQGNEPGGGGCGWAWVNADDYNMIAANDISGCSIAAMRHEVGHNLGIHHDDSSNIGSGFSHPLGSTALGGNDLNFYSSPYLYNPKYGVRLGVDGRKDAVSVINANAFKVSQY